MGVIARFLLASIWGVGVGVVVVVVGDLSFKRFYGWLCARLMAAPILVTLAAILLQFLCPSFPFIKFAFCLTLSIRTSL